jgi:SAM-dependent methyltransferase
VEIDTVIDSKSILAENQANYENLYAREEAFLRYPADWLIRFHNMFLRSRLPDGGRALDYGCGSGNNSVFLIQKGFETHGVDVAPSFKNLLKRNFELHGIDEKLTANFGIISSDQTTLPFEDATFDFIVSNQVLYYLPNEQHIKQVCNELARCLKPGGAVFFTMMGPKNYYITRHSKPLGNDTYDIRINTPGHRLHGVHEVVYLVRSEQHCRSLFGAFKPLTIGYFDQAMFDMESNFHWIYVGENAGV